MSAPTDSSLIVSATAFGGYDTDIAQAFDPALREDAALMGTTLALDYDTRSERIAFATHGAADWRNYRTSPAVGATSFSGTATLSVRVASRLKLDGSLTSMYSPQFIFSLLPQTGDVATAPTAPLLDNGLFLQDSVNYGASGTATLSVSRRSTLTMTYGRARYKFLGDEYTRFNTTGENYGAAYSYNLTRYATLRAGYAEQTGEYLGLSHLQDAIVRQRSIDAGVNYSRPLSLSRRTTVSFGTGSGAIDNGVESFYTLTGNASLRHEMGRTWTTGAVYSRGLGIVGGFAQPFFADSVSVDLRGKLTNRIAVTASGGYANGNVGLGPAANDYSSLQARGRIEVLVQRRIRLFGGYSYYGYRFGDARGITPGVPAQLARHGVRGGVTVRLPIIEERTPRVTR